jgi:hypothetical protein
MGRKSLTFRTLSVEGENTMLASLVLLVAGFASWRVDLDGDGQVEQIIFRPQVNGSIAVLRNEKVIWRGVPKRWQAWKLVISDVDGDGKKEFLVGVNIRTRYFPKRHKSVFVLGWNGKFAYARWLGSHLSKPMVDFTSAELDDQAGAELVTLEITRDGRRCIVVYRWIGFGYIVIWQSQPFVNARLFQQGKRVGVKLSDGRSFVIVRADGKLALRRYR